MQLHILHMKSSYLRVNISTGEYGEAATYADTVSLCRTGVDGTNTAKFPSKRCSDNSGEDGVWNNLTLPMCLMGVEVGDPNNPS